MILDLLIAAAKWLAVVIAIAVEVALLSLLIYFLVKFVQHLRAARHILNRARKNEHVG